MQKKNYKHVIWDWNGTLLDDTWLCVEVLNELLRKNEKVSVSVEDYRMHFGFPVIDYYRHLGFEMDETSFAAVSEHFIKGYEARWLKCRLHPGAKEVLSAFQLLGISHSVLSAAKQEALEFGISHFGLGDFFIELVGLDNILAHGKIDLGKRWMQKAHWSPEEVLLIGDTLHDFEVSQAINCDCLLLSHGHHLPERLQRCGAPIISDFTSLLNHLP
jgi:phosphoglycolate phosphatase